MRMSRWAQQQVEADLLELRLRARHDGGELDADYIRFLLEENRHLSEQAIRQTFAEGLADRATGMRCMCTKCAIDQERILQHEYMRHDYGRRRWQELRAAGMDEFEIGHRVEIEIANGAALRGATHN